MHISFAEFKTYLLKSLLPAFGITGAVLLAVTPVGCKVTEEGIQILEGDFSVPHLISVDIPDGENIVFEFDKEIADAEACVYERTKTGLENNSEEKTENLRTAAATNEKEISFTKTISQANKIITFLLSEKTMVGKEYVIEGTVSDFFGNTLTFSIPFNGYNANVPQLVISEIRNAYSSSTDSSTGSKKYKCEFIELYSLSEGNLSGIEIISAGDGEKRKYVFPECEVKAGEFIVVHLRTKEEGSIDETGSDLSLSYATDSCSTARDFWALNDKACLSASDIILVKNGNNGQLIDAFIFALSSLEEWPETYADYISAVEKSGLWKDSDEKSSCSIQSAFCSDAITSSAATRTMSRQNIPFLSANKNTSVTNDASQWIVTANKGSGKNKIPGDTPGYQNSSNEYKK